MFAASSLFSLIAVLGVSGPVDCLKQALLILHNQPDAAALCSGGKASGAEAECAERAVRLMGGHNEDVIKLCRFGGTAATGECVTEAMHWLNNHRARSVLLCSHGGTPKQMTCLREAVPFLGNNLDLAIEVCRIAPFPPSDLQSRDEASEP